MPFDLPAIDYGHRIERGKEKLLEQNLDALLLTAGPNLDYFTGVGEVLGGSGSRPILGLVPVDGELGLISHTLGSNELLHGSAVDDIRTYERLSHLPTTELRELMQDRGVSDGRIGLEFGGEARFDAPVNELLELFEDLPAAEFVDASGILAELRSVKSSGEISRIERAIEITSQAYERTFETVELGINESEIATVMENTTRELGGTPWMFLTSGSGNYDRIFRSPGDREVEEGDMVWIDAGCAVDGYWSDFSRAGIVGEPNQDQRQTQRAIHEVTMAGVDAIEPGISASEVAATCNQALDEIDVPAKSFPSRVAGRVGHSIGLQVTEPPSIASDESTTLREGMVLTVEPAVATEFGTFHVEENLVVTENGARQLTPDRWELWSC